MSSLRIQLSRIIAVNWYGYRDFIDVSGLTFITGANGSGKSALLDLLQFVMLGESLSRFNKAAAGAGSGRSLRGYCLCDTNTVGRDGQERYVRNSGVTIAALEFEWPLQAGEETPRRETWGARIEYESTTSKPRTLWFCIPSRMEEHDFLAEQMIQHHGMSFLKEDEFRVHVRRDLNGEIWERQGSYLEEMRLRTHLGFDRVQMNKTLPSSMAFQPVESFEKFIRDYLLEPGLPDVRAVRASVDAHRRAKDKLEIMHDQHQRLTRICSQHETYLHAYREWQLFSHLKDVCFHEEKKESLETKKQKLEQLRQRNAEQTEAYDQAIKERDDLGTRRSAVELTVGNDSQFAHLAQNKERRAEIEKDLVQLIAASKTARQYLYDRTQHWKNWLRLATDLGLTPPDEAATYLEQMNGDEDAPALDAAARMARVYHLLKNDAEEELRPIEERLNSLEAQEKRLTKELADLSNKGSTVHSPLLDALKSRGQRAIALGRAIEVKPEAEKWWPLLESLLGHHRQAVIAEDFTAAWDQAQRLGHTEEPLVNPAEFHTDREAAKKSVATFFDTQHAIAKDYLTQLYGDLIAVDKANQLEKHPRAISKDGWLKDPPLRVHLTPSKELTIGEEGLRRLRVLREDELNTIEEELTQVRHAQQHWKTFLHRGKESKLDDADPPPGTKGLHQLPRLKKEAQMLDETIRLLATPEREAAIEELRVLKKTHEGVIERIGRLSGALAGFEQKQREELDAITSAELEEQKAIQQRWSSRERLDGIRDAEIDHRLEEAKQQFPSWSQRIEAAKSVSDTCLHDSDKAKSQRDIERHALAEKHPETSEFFDPAEEENTRYDARRRELEDHDLERYRVEAEDAQREWEDRLQHQVLDILKEKLDEAERTKRELNKAMDHDIGGLRYQLSMKINRGHSAIWALVEKGLNPGLELFASGAKEEIERAKQELMMAIENAEDPRHQRALDYRYYHHWDIDAIPSGKGAGAAISLNKSSKKQSGGENQAPFFVAMLAAFQRVYDLGKKEERRNLGLVIMDEAFSKLSGDRIDACLALAQNFGLQLVMAFPEDRLPTMIQHAETVVQANVERTYDDDTGAVMNIRNSCVRVTREHLAALG